MPVSIITAGDPFGWAKAAAARRVPKLRLQQFRVLHLLMPSRPDDPQFDWPLVTRSVLAKRAGFTKLSGSITRAMNGIRDTNNKSGKPHAGLIALGLVEVITLDIDGVSEDSYRITLAGIRAYQAHVAAHGEVPPNKDRRTCVNKRYKKEKEVTND